MHIDFLTEGIVDELNEFEKWWSTRTVPMKMKDKDGKDVMGSVQLGLRERRAYTLVFPEEALPIVMNTLNPSYTVNLHNPKHSKIFGTFIRLARKYLRLKPLPEKDPTKGRLAMRDFRNIRVVGLGIRKDEIQVTEKDGKTHEGL